MTTIKPHPEEKWAWPWAPIYLQRPRCPLGVSGSSCCTIASRMNTLPSRYNYNLCHFNLTMSPTYLVKLKIAQNSRPLTALHSVEQIVLNFYRKSLNVYFYPQYCYKISLAASLTTIFDILVGFCQNLSSNSVPVWLILTHKLKLNLRWAELHVSRVSAHHTPVIREAPPTALV